MLNLYILGISSPNGETQMKVKLLILGILWGQISFAAIEKSIVEADKIKKTLVEKSLFYPISIRSRIESQIISDNDYIILKRLVHLGQKVKKGTPLLQVRNQDTSVHYENRIIKAPISGVVANIQVSAGEFVRAGGNLIFINDPSKLYGEIQIPNADFKNFKLSLETKISIPSLDLSNSKAYVSAIGSTAHNITGTIPVEINLKKPNDYIPGVIGTAEVLLKKEEHILVEEKSLYYVGDDVLMATLAEGNIVEKKKIKLGKRFKDKVEILEGINIGTPFVKASPKYLRDGEQVEVKEN